MKIRFNQQAIDAWVKGPEVSTVVSQATNRVAMNAGKGFDSHISRDGNRVRGYVKAKTHAAYTSALKEHALEKAIGQGI